MKSRARITLAALGCLGLVLAYGVKALVEMASIRDEERARRPLPALPAEHEPGDVLDWDPIEAGGLEIARQFSAPIHDPGSLRELRAAVEMRALLGLAVLTAESDSIRIGIRAPKEEIATAARLLHQIGLLNLYEGRYSEASASIRKALEARPPRRYPDARSGSKDRSARNRRAPQGRGGEWSREPAGTRLDFSGAARGGSQFTGGLARGRRVVHVLPSGVAGRSPRSLAAEHRLHEAGRVSRQGTRPIPHSARHIPICARCGPVRERGESGRTDLDAPEPSRRECLR